MRPSTTTLLVILTVAALSGCGVDSPTAPPVKPSLSLADANAGATNPRRFSGDCTITSAQVIAFTPPILNQVSTAVCRLSHLGLVAITNNQQINVATGAQIGAATYTTANGDLLYATSAGTATPSSPGNLDFTGITTIAGGTGRFASATGQANVSGRVSTDGGSGSFTYDGWIVYDASNRADR